MAEPVTSNDEMPSTTVRTFMLALATDHGPRLFAFRISNLLIGRMPDNHLALNHASVSRRHAKIAVSQKGVTLEDLNSQNGTTINGKAVQGTTTLRPGDIIRAGHVPIYYFGFINPSSPPSAEIIENTVLVSPIVPALD